MFSSFFAYQLQNNDESSMYGILYPALNDINKHLPRTYRELHEANKKIIEDIKTIDMEMTPDKPLESNAERYFMVLKQAAETDKGKVRMIALDTINKLLSYKYLLGNSEVDSVLYPPLFSPAKAVSGKKTDDVMSAKGKKRLLIDVIMEILYNSSLFRDDSVHLCVLKCILTAIQSTSSPVHDQSVTLSVRSCFHIYIHSDNLINRNTSKATVIQIVTLTFKRMDIAYQSVKNLNTQCQELEDLIYHKKIQNVGNTSSVVSSASTLSHSSDDDVSKDKAIDNAESKGDESSDTENIDASAISAEIKTLSEEDPDQAKLSQLYDNLFYHRQQLLMLQADAYQIMRSLGKQSLKVFDPDFTDPPPINLQRHYLLTLELVLYVLRDPGRIISSSLPFVATIRDEILPSLAIAFTTSIDDMFKLGSQIVQCLMLHFRAELKIELLHFIKFILIDSLTHPNATFHHKVTILDLLVAILRDRTIVLELLLNGDLSCEPSKLTLSPKLSEIFRKRKGSVKQIVYDDPLAAKVSPEQAEEELEVFNQLLPQFASVPHAIVRDLLLAFQFVLQTNHVASQWMTVRDDQELKTLTIECVNCILRAFLSFQSEVVLHKYHSPYPSNIAKINGNHSDDVILKYNTYTNNPHDKSSYTEAPLPQPLLLEDTTQTNSLVPPPPTPVVSNIQLLHTRWDEQDAFRYIMSKIFIPLEVEEVFSFYYTTSVTTQTVANNAANAVVNSLLTPTNKPDGPTAALPQGKIDMSMKPAALEAKLEPINKYISHLRNNITTMSQLLEYNKELMNYEEYSHLKGLITTLECPTPVLTEKGSKPSRSRRGTRSSKSDSKDDTIDSKFHLDWLEAKDTYCYYLENKIQRFLWDCGIYLFNVEGFGQAFKVFSHFKLLDVNDPRVVAAWLYHTPDLNKAQMGEVLGGHTRICTETLRCFMEYFNFKSCTFDEALREFLQAFRLPGEAQCIDRLADAFGTRFCLHNPGIFSSPDTAFVLAFSTIMLNTDLHSPQIAKKMSKPDFFKNNAKIDNNKDLDPAFLGAIYDNILLNEIKMKQDERHSWSGYSSRKRLQMFVKDGRETSAYFNKQYKHTLDSIATNLELKYKPNPEIKLPVFEDASLQTSPVAETPVEEEIVTRPRSAHRPSKVMSIDDQLDDDGFIEAQQHQETGHSATGNPMTKYLTMQDLLSSYAKEHSWDISRALIERRRIPLLSIKRAIAQEGDHNTSLCHYTRLEAKHITVVGPMFYNLIPIIMSCYCAIFDYNVLISAQGQHSLQQTAASPNGQTLTPMPISTAAALDNMNSTGHSSPSGSNVSGGYGTQLATNTAQTSTTQTISGVMQQDNKMIKLVMDGFRYAVRLCIVNNFKLYVDMFFMTWVHCGTLLDFNMSTILSLYSEDNSSNVLEQQQQILNTGTMRIEVIGDNEIIAESTEPSTISPSSEVATTLLPVLSRRATSSSIYKDFDPQQPSKPQPIPPPLLQDSVELVAASPSPSATPRDSATLESVPEQSLTALTLTSVQAQSSSSNSTSEPSAVLSRDSLTINTNSMSMTNSITAPSPMPTNRTGFPRPDEATNVTNFSQSPTPPTSAATPVTSTTAKKSAAKQQAKVQNASRTEALTSFIAAVVAMTNVHCLQSRNVEAFRQLLHTVSYECHYLSQHAWFIVLYCISYYNRLGLIYKVDDDGQMPLPLASHASQGPILPRELRFNTNADGSYIEQLDHTSVDKFFNIVTTLSPQILLIMLTQLKVIVLYELYPQQTVFSTYQQIHRNRCDSTILSSYSHVNYVLSSLHQDANNSLFVKNATAQHKDELLLPLLSSQSHTLHTNATSNSTLITSLEEYFTNTMLALHIPPSNVPKSSIITATHNATTQAALITAAPQYNVPILMNLLSQPTLFLTLKYIELMYSLINFEKVQSQQHRLQQQQLLLQQQAQGIDAPVLTSIDIMEERINAAKQGAKMTQPFALKSGSSIAEVENDKDDEDIAEQIDVISDVEAATSTKTISSTINQLQTPQNALLNKLMEEQQKQYDYKRRIDLKTAIYEIILDVLQMGGSHSNGDINTHILTITKQLCTEYLPTTSPHTSLLTNYLFSPFEFIIKHHTTNYINNKESSSAAVLDFTLGCLEQIIKSQSQYIHTGWGIILRSLMYIPLHDKSSCSLSLINTSHSLLETISEHYFNYITSSSNINNIIDLIMTVSAFSTVNQHTLYTGEHNAEISQPTASAARMSGKVIQGSNSTTTTRRSSAAPATATQTLPGVHQLSAAQVHPKETSTTLANEIVIPSTTMLSRIAVYLSKLTVLLNDMEGNCEEYIHAVKKYDQDILSYKQSPIIVNELRDRLLSMNMLAQHNGTVFDEKYKHDEHYVNWHSVLTLSPFISNDTQESDEDHAEISSIVTLPTTIIHNITEIAKKMFDEETNKSDTEEHKAEYVSAIKARIGKSRQRVTQLWLLLLKKLSNILVNHDVSVRSHGLMIFDKILLHYGSLWTKNEWELIFTYVFIPIFDYINIYHYNPFINELISIEHNNTTNAILGTNDMNSLPKSQQHTKNIIALQNSAVNIKYKKHIDKWIKTSLHAIIIHLIHIYYYHHLILTDFLPYLLLILYKLINTTNIDIIRIAFRSWYTLCTHPMTSMVTSAEDKQEETNTQTSTKEWDQLMVWYLYICKYILPTSLIDEKTRLWLNLPQYTRLANKTSNIAGNHNSPFNLQQPSMQQVIYENGNAYQCFVPFISTVVDDGNLSTITHQFLAFYHDSALPDASVITVEPHICNVLQLFEEYNHILLDECALFHKQHFDTDSAFDEITANITTEATFSVVANSVTPTPLESFHKVNTSTQFTLIPTLSITTYEKNHQAGILDTKPILRRIQYKTKQNELEFAKYADKTTRKVESIHYEEEMIVLHSKVILMMIDTVFNVFMTLYPPVSQNTPYKNNTTQPSNSTNTPAPVNIDNTNPTSTAFAALQLGDDHLVCILDTLYIMIDFANEFNSDFLLRKLLWRTGFLSSENNVVDLTAIVTRAMKIAVRLGISRLCYTGDMKNVDINFKNVITQKKKKLKQNLIKRLKLIINSTLPAYLLCCQTLQQAAPIISSQSTLNRDIPADRFLSNGLTSMIDTDCCRTLDQVLTEILIGILDHDELIILFVSLHYNSLCMLAALGSEQVRVVISRLLQSNIMIKAVDIGLKHVMVAYQDDTDDNN